MYFSFFDIHTFLPPRALIGARGGKDICLFANPTDFCVNFLTKFAMFSIYFCFDEKYFFVTGWWCRALFPKSR